MRADQPEVHLCGVTRTWSEAAERRVGVGAALHAQNSSLLLIPASSLHTVTGNRLTACSELQSPAHACFKSAHSHS